MENSNLNKAKYYGSAYCVFITGYISLTAPVAGVPPQHYQNPSAGRRCYYLFSLKPFSIGRTAKDKLGVALVGLGYYSTDLLAPALQQTKHCYLSGIVTSTPPKNANVGTRRRRHEGYQDRGSNLQIGQIGEDHKNIIKKLHSYPINFIAGFRDSMILDKK